MAYLLRTLLVLMLSSLALTTSVALDLIELPLSHISIAIPTFIYTIFAQAFVMFYFIGVARLSKNVETTLHEGVHLDELFDGPPEDLGPYQQKVKKFVYDADLAKRQTVPWTMLILILGTIAFLLGGAHDTGIVKKYVHSGVVYGFLSAVLIGSVRQWYYLGKSHLLLRKLKALFSLPDHQM